MTLADYLATAPGRCRTCGFHLKHQTCQCAGSEWSTFVAALKQARRSDDTVHQCDVRPLIRGRIAPKSIGTFYRRAKSDGLLVDTGEREQSNDVAGRNQDKLDRIYVWQAAA